jgi:lysophospholipase L1-like esterase
VPIPYLPTDAIRAFGLFHRGSSTPNSQVTGRTSANRSHRRRRSTLVKSTRTSAILLAAVAAIGAMSVSACAGPSVQRDPVDPNAPVVAFYGDSYTLGTGASSYAERWSTCISEERGWTEFNPSVNGLGFVNNRSDFGDGSGDLPDLIIEQDPDIVFVTMGLNDNFSFDFAAEKIETQITDDLTRLDDALPDARFIVVEPFWYTDERPASVDTIIGWVERAAGEIGADYIPGASRYLEGHPEWMASDGLHPNDEGYAEMTAQLDAALTELGL